ncbi:crotonyl-CoA reductase [Janibacter hoylei PVAS-1]|uniref:Crotonyl-CoA reductase n=1 Tax=Janibacter hoylei PVAS-1 TaxID=1210046 RepID=K1DUN4_9MICO|nr:crotonyl-CoA reductase [Janibacter hoylei PVAS-1]
MHMAIDQIRDAILSGDRSEETYANLPLPDTYRATTVHKDEVEMFKGLKSRDKDPRKSLHIDDVPIPELAPDEALVAVMASAINFNTVWTSIFEPVSTFGFLERYGRLNKYSKRHDLPYHIVGSDLSGVVLRTGGHVSKWKPGQEVVAHCLSVELEDADGHDDTMMDPQQRIWGFETNFGGLAELAIVKANQLMPKPEHLTWEESASPRSGELHRLPPADLQERRRAQARRPRAHLGRLGWSRLLRDADGARGRRDPDLRRLLPREGPDLPRHGRGADHRPQCRGLQVLERRQHRAEPEGVAAPRQEDP